MIQISRIKINKPVAWHTEAQHLQGQFTYSCVNNAIYARFDSDVCVLHDVRNKSPLRLIHNIKWPLAVMERPGVHTEVTIKFYFFFFWLMTNLTHSFLMYLFHASTCLEQQVLIIRRAKFY
jgi:hypothetical protein